MSRPLYLNGVILDGANADFSAYTKLSVPVNTSADAPTRRDYVDAQILEQKERIDGILSGAGVSLDNLKEISDYVNSLDETQRLDILSKVAELNATITANKEASELRDANLRTDLEAEAAARALAVSTEQNRATAAEQLVQSNLNALSALELKHYNQQNYLNEVEQRVRNVSSVYADGSPALVPDAALLTEQGWYYKKSAAAGNKKHNWYLPVPEGLKVKHLKSLSLYAKIQTTSPLQRDGELPFFGIYTARLGDGKDRASWYRSRITWSGDMNNGDYQGKKVLRVKLDATREHINNGDYSPVEYALAFNTLYSTGNSSLADVGEEAVSMIHISSNSSALAHQEYFVHSLKIQLEAHTHNYILDGADVDLEKRVADVQTNLNTAKAALEAADASEAAARLAGDLAEAAARVDAIQQEAAARQAAIEAEANARAIKDGEQDAALEAERVIRRDEVLAAQEYTGSEILSLRNYTDASILAERDERLEQANLHSIARIEADDAIIATAAINKAAADLAIERLAELYLYFNQTYESVYAHNHPVPPPTLSLLANGYTIRYSGSLSDFDANPSQPIFKYEDPRGTGTPEWFAIINDSHKNYLKDYLGIFQAVGPGHGLSLTSVPYAYFTPPGETNTVNVDNIITTLMTDMSRLFYGRLCYNNSVASWDTSNVTDMNLMFAYQAQSDNKDYGFNHPSIQYWDVSKVTKFGGMFANNYAFKVQGALGGWDMSSATDTNHMFKESTFNDSIANWNTSNVTNMERMFYYSYMTFDVSMLNVDNVTSWVGFIGGGTQLSDEFIPAKFRDGTQRN